ncbi:MAG: HNH endonuclease [Bdellovibrio sp.]|nr:HNH endonuclease [Bdellovibrio sp.]
MTLGKSVAAAELELREYFNLAKKKRVITIEVDEETYQLWEDTKARLQEPKDRDAFKKIMATFAAPKREQTKVRQSSSARGAGVVLRRELLKKAQYRCEFVSANGTRCESLQFLQCDHITPHSICGETAQSNMRILCSEHNKLAYQKFSCFSLG